ncbi:ABC transporter ATP-binding protein [Tumebacillus permanentifrigoris]|uniref:Putative ABC transport system ATP-binding protein n=1 Tax=Tumebacillus permanentifrigoris TaxID=378543 RepID=A0A316DCT9_9BACL|nr:ABC transporter ATP-binding protein [Tumebacillus permanentifrigoris]PWK15775.1 putative ABC transport system ATP-binding protein [Tumebacillus permanentifrigoris]
MIDLCGVTKTYDGPGLQENRDRKQKIHALGGIDLHIPRGEFVAIMGPSGSGKSTLLSILGLLSQPTAGTMVLDGLDVTGLRERERTRLRAEQIGFVFQFPSLVNTLNVRENVLLPKMLTGSVTKSDRARADSLLADMGLAGREEERSFKLSGGEQRRVALARALISDPAVVLADEPTGALDEATAGELMGLLGRLHAAGKTVVMVTHDRAMAQYATRTVKIKSGVIGSCSMD